MRKFVVVILLFLTITLWGEDKTPAPYESDEFIPLLYDVRRSSVIFCGAFPLGYMYSSIVFDSTNIDAGESDNQRIANKLVSSLIFSGVVMVVDLIIEKFFIR